MQIASAAANLNNMWEYALEAANVAKLACNIMDAVVQTLRLPSPNPFLGVELIGTFSDPTHIFPHFEKDRRGFPRTPPPPSHLPPSSLVSTAHPAPPRPAALCAHASSVSSRAAHLVLDRQ